MENKTRASDRRKEDRRQTQSGVETDRRGVGRREGQRRNTL